MDSQQYLLRKVCDAIPLNNIRPLIQCSLCKGHLRFAHTIVECGHTFCRLCIFDYINSFKGRKPEVRCPECHQVIDSNYKKSIFDDHLKQKIVDSFCAEAVQKQKKTIEIIEKLFPECNLSFLNDGTENKSEAVRRLPELVTLRLGIKFYTFCDKIVTNQGNPEAVLKEMQDMLKNKAQESVDAKIKLFLYPRTDSDYECIKIKNQVYVSVSAEKLKRSISRSFYKYVKETGKIPSTLLSKNNDSLNIIVRLWLDGTEIPDKENLEDLRWRLNRDILTLYYQLDLPY